MVLESSSFDFEDAKKLVSSTVQTQRQSIGIWAGFIFASAIIYWIFSSGDFSFLLTFAAFLRCFGFGLLNTKMWKQQSAKRVSVKTLELYALTFLFRLISILQHQGYLPFDKSGDWLYHLIEMSSMFLVCLAIYGIFTPFVSTYDEKFDKFGNMYVPSELGALWLLVPSVIIAIVLHPTLNKDFLSDTCWTLSMYLEAVAMLPQIYMFQKQAAESGGQVEPLLGHTIFALGFSRIFELIFWLGSFKELSDHNGGRMPGYVVLLSQLGHMVVMGDFFYYYIKSLSVGLPMEIPPEGIIGSNYMGLDV